MIGASPVELRVLGPVEARRHDGEFIPMERMVRGLLVVLVLNLGLPLSDKQLSDFLWGGGKSSKWSITRYVTALRKVVRELDPGADLVRAEGLLSLRLPSRDVVDLHRFQQHLTAAEAGGEPDHVLAELAAAIGEFRSEPWAGLTVSVRLETERATLVERWKKACHQRVQLLASLDRNSEAADALDDCRRRWPDDERFLPQGRTATPPVDLATALFEPDYVLDLEPLPSALLQAEYRVVGFDEVDDHLSRLKTWLSGPDSIDLRLITGPGGRGKTRIAHELVRFARRNGWTAGFSREDAPDGALDQVLAGSAPVLLVIDYAEGRTDEVTAVVRAVLVRNAKVRIVLLARSAGLLLDNVSRDKDSRITKLLTKMVVEPVRSLPAGTGDRRRWFEQAVRAFTPRLAGIPAGAVRPPADLDDARYDRMLDVHAAALAAVLDVIAGVKAPERQDPLARVLDHEERYWLKSADAHDLADASLARLSAIVSVATLFGAETADDADQLLAGLRTFRGASTDLVDRYATWLATMYPGPAALNPLRPDRLGEDLVLRFLDTTRGAADTLVGTFNEDQVIRAVVVLARASSRHEGVHRYLAELIEPDKEHRLPIAVAVAGQVESPQLVEVITQITAADPALTEVVVNQLPHKSLALSVFAAAQTRALLRLELGRDPVDTEFVAEVRQNLALRLLEVGEFDDALAVAGEAVADYRAFPEPTPDDLVGLAIALDTLATTYAKLGMRSDGIEMQTEAVELLETLIEQAHPGHTDSAQRLTHLRATALINLGVLLEADGSPEEALPHISRGVDDLLVLMRADHPGVRADYANGLQSLGSCWASIGRHDEHIAACLKAVDILRELDGAAPDAYRGDLVGLLGTLAGAHAQLGQIDRGIEVGQEAVTLARALIDRYGHTHDVLLADALTNTASLFRQVRQHENALECATEAVELFRSLAARQPGEHLAGLALALYNLGVDLAHADRAEDALDAYGEATDIYRKLTEPRPDLFEPELADALVGMAGSLSEVDEDEAALELATEAVELLRRAVRAETAALKEKLADALHTASAAAFHLGDLARAVPDGLKALEIYRVLISAGEHLPRDSFVRILRNTARVVEADEQHELALRLYQEMISVLREVVDEGGDVADEIEHLAVACLNAGVCAANLQDLEATARLTGEAVEHRRALLGTEFESIVYLAEALTNMSHARCDLGHLDEARDLAEEAVALLSALTDEERLSHLVSALVAQAYATNTDDRVGAQLLLNRAMNVAGEDEDLRDEVDEAMAELGFRPET